MTKIFISGYPQETDEICPTQLVSPYGKVVTIKIVRDKDSQKLKRLLQLVIKAYLARFKPYKSHVKRTA